MALKQKMVEYEKKMERLKILLYIVESSDAEIDAASENKIDFKMCKSYDNDS